VQQQRLAALAHEPARVRGRNRVELLHGAQLTHADFGKVLTRTLIDCLGNFWITQPFVRNGTSVGTFAANGLDRGCGRIPHNVLIDKASAPAR
jgi:hypothetical protein